MNVSERVVITADSEDLSKILTAEAVGFIEKLHNHFEPRRRELLRARERRQVEIDGGGSLGFPEETAQVRASRWSVAACPEDLQNRRVEITGPCERKMMINALNSGAQVFMADCEDAQSPTWENQVKGQANLREAVRRTLSIDGAGGRKSYRLSDEPATLLVRPRGWHLSEKHLLVGDLPTSASLFDFGLYFFHNASELLNRGTAPYFYLAKLESYLEARLWNDVFVFAQRELGIPVGSIRATVLIETIHAAHQMEEILYELREHAAGLNAGRWDYIFSCIKTFRANPAALFPDRSQVTMTVPFMRAYTDLLVQTCHKRAAHAIGGMSAFIPNRRDPAVTERALEQVMVDKAREAGQGFDGTWIAHPDLVSVARSQFDAALGERPHQKSNLREDVTVSSSDLTDFTIPGRSITEAGLRLNVSVAIQYLDSWLQGRGAAAINNLMEDAATSEICRAQLWQWIQRGARLADGRRIDRDLYARVRDEELAALGPAVGRAKDAAALLDSVVDTDCFPAFLTLPAYEMLD